MSWVSDLLVRIKGDNSDLNAKLKGAEGSVSTFATKASGLLKGLFTGGVLIAVAGFAKAVIGASETLSDKFSFAVAGAKGALTEFLRMTTTMNFSNFIGQLSEGYDKAKSLAQALDDLKDKKAYVDYITSGKKQEAGIQEEIVKDKTGKYTLDRRKKAAEDLKAIEAEIRDMTAKALKDTYDLEAQAWKNRNGLTVEKGKELYETVTNLSENTKAKLDQIFTEADKLYKGKDIFGSKAKYINQKAGVISPEVVQSYREYLNLLQGGEEELIPKLYKIFQDFNEGKISAQERFNGVLRITNTLLERQLTEIERASTKQLTGLSQNNVSTGSAFDKKTYGLTGALPGIQNYSGTNGSAKDVNDAIANIDSDAALANMEALSVRFDEILTDMRDSAVDYGAQIVEALGEALGGGDITDIGRGLLMSLANFLSQFGTMLITAGLGIEAFSKSMASGNGVGAVIAGAAMLVAAGAIRGMMSNAGSNGLSGSGSGGGYSSSQGNMTVQVEGVLKGKDIYWSAKRFVEDNQ